MKVILRREWAIVKIEQLERDLLLAREELRITEGQLSRTNEPGRMTFREREILALVRSKLQNKEIASKLNISLKTVKFHVTNILTKHGVMRRTEL